MRILDLLIDGLVQQFMGVDTENVMNAYEWREFCASAIERNITKDEFISELSKKLGDKG